MFKMYDIHMRFVKEYGYRAWSYLVDMVSEDIRGIMAKKYNSLDNKLKRLVNENYKGKPGNKLVHGDSHKFYDRVVNMSKVQFSEREHSVLCYGPKHSFITNHKQQSDTLATDVECSIRQLKDCNRNEIRHDVSKKIYRERSMQTSSSKQIQEFKVCLDVKRKLEVNNLVAVKADKSNAMVVMEKVNYISKTETFITENNFKELKVDPTNKFQDEITKIIKLCPKIISEDVRFRSFVNNPTAPTMKGVPKIHKPNVPIRPLVNFRSAPTYNVSKILSNMLSADLNLDYRYAVRNSIDFVKKASGVELRNNTKLASFDICNLYTNVPIGEVISIIKDKLLHRKLENAYVNQMVKLLKTILKQNYFRFNNRYYVQNDGLAMGSPLSAILSEVFLQHHEDAMLDKLKKDHDIVFYTRYVDDILVMFNQKSDQDLEAMLELLNSHHNNLKFTSEFEKSSQINFLDLTVLRSGSKLCYGIFRKPTQTDCVINNNSVHPLSQKMASFRSMLFRAYSVPLSDIDRKKEINIIKAIATANGYNPAIIDEIGSKIRRKIGNGDVGLKGTTLSRYGIDGEPKKYVSLHYNGKLSQTIANRFKKFNLAIGFKTSNRLSDILHPSTENKNKFNNSGVYRVNCRDCDMFYIGQTVNFNKRFKNHISAYKNKKPERSNVAKHLLDCGHTIGSIEEDVDIIKRCDKGKIMDAWEELFIFKEKCSDRRKLMNEQVNFDSEIVYSNFFK